MTHKLSMQMTQHNNNTYNDFTYNDNTYNT
jgi:hypothetical protein